MQAQFSRLSERSDDEWRMVRLARGLCAVAAAAIVGGIVLATFDGPTPVARSVQAMAHDEVAA